MKIGFDISQTGENKAGCGYFADSLIQSLAVVDKENQYILYPHFGITFWDPKGKNTTRNINRRNFSRILISNNFQTSITFWERLPDHGEQTIGNPDIVHANNFSCPQGIQKAKIVYTLYDLAFLIHPEFTTEHNRWICFQGVLNASCYADFIVAISDYTRRSFLETFPHYPTDRIRTVHLASRFSSIIGNRQGSPIAGLVPDKFWLAVGTLQPRKNLRRLLRAYASFIHRNQEGLSLVLVGGKGWMEEDIEEFICNLGIREHVRILGYVNDDKLIWLYKNCFAFIYPSLFEGFGLPVLEALSLGAAVVTSNTTSLPEVAGEAACYVNPLREENITSALLRLADDEEYRMVLKNLAKAQAMKFSWEKCAEQVMDIYSEVMKLPKSG